MGKCALLWFGCGAEIRGRSGIWFVSAQEWGHRFLAWALAPLSPFLYQEEPPTSHIWKAKLVHSRSVAKPKLPPFWLLNPFCAHLAQGLCTQAGLTLGKYSNFVFSCCSQVKKVRWERHNNMFLSPPSPVPERFASTYLLPSKPLTSTVSVFCSLSLTPSSLSSLKSSTRWVLRSSPLWSKRSSRAISRWWVPSLSSVASMDGGEATNVSWAREMAVGMLGGFSILLTENY